MFSVGPLFGGGDAGNNGTFCGGGGYPFTVSGHGPNSGPGPGVPPDAHTHAVAKNNFHFDNGKMFT